MRFVLTAPIHLSENSSIPTGSTGTITQYDADHQLLTAPIDTVPAGATGQLKRLDDFHVALLFDNHHYEDLVFDIQDTEPAVGQLSGRTLSTRA